FTLSSDGRFLARQTGNTSLEVRDLAAGGGPTCVSPKARFHNNATLELGEAWLRLRIHTRVHFVSWAGGNFEHRYWDGNEEFQKHVGQPVRAPDTAAPAQATSLPALRGILGHDEHRYVAAARSNLVAVLDRF